jgi:ubiquinone/menaquinone biosynthesis C-methylase UbiE
MASSVQSQQPNPALIFETLNAYQRPAALKAAIQLDIFTAIGAGATTAEALARGCSAAERGVRILCDYLVILGLLTKEGDRYGLTPDSAMFLDRRSPACLASIAQFLLTPELTDPFKDLTAVVRKGGTILPGAGTVEPDNPLWVIFARTMAPLMSLPAKLMGDLLHADTAPKWKVLDIAAGHGFFGIELARRNRNAEIFAVDWPKVLEVARENAQKAGVTDRYRTIPGNAFEVDLGKNYDLVLLTNFLHHFDPRTIETFLRKVNEALAPGGRAVTLEFVPNDDRVTPRDAAAFSMIMLGTTASGDAYTFCEYQRMFRNAGFRETEKHEIPPAIHNVLVSHK